MGQVVPLRPDTYAPLRFDATPDEARSMHADFRIATELLQWAQQVRLEATSIGLDGTRRAQLLLAWGVAKEHPEP